MTWQWHSEPPEWAAYVGNVLVVDRGDEVHVSLEMSCKRVEADASVDEEEAGVVRVLFFPADDPDRQIKWPDDPGPWTGTVAPVVVLHLGLRVRDMEVVRAGTARYTTRVSLVMRVDWNAAESMARVLR